MGAPGEECQAGETRLPLKYANQHPHLHGSASARSGKPIAVRKAEPQTSLSPADVMHILPERAEEQLLEFVGVADACWMTLMLTGREEGREGNT